MSYTGLHFGLISYFLNQIKEPYGRTPLLHHSFHSCLILPTAKILAAERVGITEWMDERTNKQPRVHESDSLISDHFREEWGSFPFPEVFLLWQQERSTLFFFLILLNSIRDLAGKQEAGQ